MRSIKSSQLCGGASMMNGSYGWMGGGMWIWVVTTLVVVALLVFIVGKLSKK
jgi:uncharacterized membrane protein